MNVVTPVERPQALALEDVQGRTDLRRIPINQVGIRDIMHPVRVMDRARGEQATVATFKMVVNLPHDVKGTHMSRFVELLHRLETVSAQSFSALVEHMTAYLNATEGRLEMTFPYFVTKVAPVSGARSVMNYQATFCGDHRDGGTQVWLKVVVPVTSLCPCSKKISDYGAHNQRSHLTLKVRLGAPMWFEELIDVAEAQASCEVYGVLKRADEKYVTERAYDNPKFVEDTVRDLAAALDADGRVRAYVVESENFESIHNHSAYALIERDKDAAV